MKPLTMCIFIEKTFYLHYKYDLLRKMLHVIKLEQFPPKFTINKIYFYVKESDDLMQFKCSTSGCLAANTTNKIQKYF